MRKVTAKGLVCFRSELWTVGEAFRGQEVGLRQTGEERYDVYYCWKKIGVIDVAQHRASGKEGWAQITDQRVGRLLS